ncbi:transcriptional regulator (GntR family) [Oceanobacillus iheyensis HTE831]|uniref:Transcriptional regulator (GntR family) n=1 Tax=Oceanobacillus iheyensis (strain DSM 14371 / CIP 107618 / JCM 11309 / KCTC 3954 / HTE831) TaxID=221109 RepID=Q8CUZ0_OCEIH|nr:GntR family transcriptional regulator [Oceanobacillus iheyensis]BAC12923.1 transcriptional regulator (GntR family) [Oceanobacillus iheyensis HTE831]
MENKEMLIVDDLMNQIKQKKIQPGEKFPSENALTEMYKVPRMTVRNAFNTLEERGFIQASQGKGRFLKGKSIQIKLPLTGDTSFTEKMEQMGYNLQTKNVLFKKVDYNPSIFNRLHASENENVYQVVRLRYINGEIIAIHYSFIKESTVPKIVEEGPEILSMFRFYRQQGFKKFTSNKSILSVTFPTLEEQQLLECKSMIPLIVVETDCTNKETNQILEYTKILYRSDTFKYDISTIT